MIGPRRQIGSFLHRPNLRRFRWQTVDRLVIHVPKTAGSFVKKRILSVDQRALDWGHRSLRDSRRLVRSLARGDGPVLVAGIREPIAWYSSLFNDHFFEDFVAPFSVRPDNGDLNLEPSILRIFSATESRPNMPPK